MSTSKHLKWVLIARFCLWGGLIVLGFLLGFLQLMNKAPKVARHGAKSAPKIVTLSKGRSLGGDDWVLLRSDFLDKTQNTFFVSESQLNQWGVTYFQRSSRGADSGPSFQFLAGHPNFKITPDDFQVIVPLKISFLGFGRKSVYYYQVKGSFQKNGKHFSLEPEKSYIGSAPIPSFLSNIFMGRIVSRYKDSDEFKQIQARWNELNNVSIAGDKLVLVRS